MQNTNYCIYVNTYVHIYLHVSEHFKTMCMPATGRHGPGFCFCVDQISACVFVCVSISRLLITSGMIWTPCDWLNKGYSFNMAAVVVTSGRCGFRIELRHSKSS